MHGMAAIRLNHPGSNFGMHFSSACIHMLAEIDDTA